MSIANRQADRREKERNRTIKLKRVMVSERKTQKILESQEKAGGQVNRWMSKETCRQADSRWTKNKKQIKTDEWTDG